MHIVLQFLTDSVGSENFFANPNVARGSLFTASVVESLLASMYFEDYLGTIVKRLTCSSKNGVELVRVPEHLLVRVEVFHVLLYF